MQIAQEVPDRLIPRSDRLIEHPDGCAHRVETGETTASAVASSYRDTAPSAKLVVYTNRPLRSDTGQQIALRTLPTDPDI